METPSSVLFTDLKNFGRVSNRDAALVLLDGGASYGGELVRNRIEDRTFLSRTIVHALPGSLPRRIFADIPTATLTLASRIAERRGGMAAGPAAVFAHYRGPAAAAMQEALAACGLDGTLYRNALDRILGAALPAERAQSTLCLMLFTATGCLGDPLAAANLVEDFARSKLATGLFATELSVGEGYARAESAPAPTTTLGLLRVVGGVARMPLRPLSTNPEGTMIGTLATGPGAITDVDRDVSRHHLRIWLEDGRWLAQGAGSTNGSIVVSGDAREARQIEPPRAEREPGATYPPVEIANGDILCLGATTQFLVMQVMS